ncbi:MAG TPA: sterol desaturase family protein [Pelomicrobium sp.]|nr:sterol desaturase family protein [Pelomicrobium sp.]
MDEINAFLIRNEALVRLAAFAGVFAAMALAETLWSRRARQLARPKRWLPNLALVAVDAAVVRLLFPAAAVGFAALAAREGWGLLNAWTLPPWAAFALGFLALDLAVYLQHVMFHAVPALWRLHRVHHADVDFDVTTGLRFHPLEIVLSMLIKFATIAVTGAPVAAVIAFEVVLNGAALFNHANLRLPAAVDRRLRWLLVTPDMHRIHHSMERAETDSNYGFSVSWWDRLFGTYRERARLPQERMEIGVRGLTGGRDAVTLAGMLRLPFRGSEARADQLPSRSETA